MTIDYNKFMELAPETTKTMVTKLLPYLDYYLNSSRPLELTSGKSEYDYYLKFFFLLALVLSEEDEYKSLFRKYNFNSSRLKIETDKFLVTSDKASQFTPISNVLNKYNDEILLTDLTILDIVENVFDKCLAESTDKSSLYFLFPLLPNQRPMLIKDDISKQNLKIHSKQEKEVEQEIYKDLSISVIFYLETASKIRKLLIQGSISCNLRLFKKEDSDLCALSLLLSIFFYKDTINQSDDIPIDSVVIRDFLELKNLTFDRVNSLFFSMKTIDEIDNTERNLNAIKYLYKPYLEKGIYEHKSLKEVTVAGIIENLFCREVSNSLVIEKILTELGCSLETFDSFEKELKKFLIARKKYASYIEEREYYYVLKKETRNFLDTATKVSLIIHKKLASKSINCSFLVTKDDVVTVSLLIASYYVGADISQFFSDYGVTLEKILSFLNLDITKEEIEKTPFETKKLLEQYKRYIQEGANTHIELFRIEVKDITHNLCSQGFCRSLIMKTIFENISNKIVLDNDFYFQLTKHLENKEKLKQKQLKNEFFKDLHVSTITLLEHTSRIHSIMLKNNCKLSKEETKIVSLLLASLIIEDVGLKDFLNYLKIFPENIKTFFNIDHVDITNAGEAINTTFHQNLGNNEDIQLLVDNYQEYIFGGYNQNKEHQDITPYSLLKNIFNNDLHDSIEFRKFLNSCNNKFDTWNEKTLDELYDEYLSKLKQVKLIFDYKNLISKYSNGVQLYLQDVFCTHDRIKNYLSKETINNKLLVTDDDICVFSLLHTYITHCNNNFFEKNGLSIDVLYRECNLPITCCDGVALEFETTDFDYSCAPFYDKYLENIFPLSDDNKNFLELTKMIFNSEISNSSLLEIIMENISQDYNILKREVITGKDYELSLSITERIALLENKMIDTLDISDIKSVLNFGNSLTIHSNYIYNELPKLELSEIHTNSIKTINSLLEKVSTKKEDDSVKPKNFWEKLFSKISESIKSNEIVSFDEMVMDELKKAIDDNIIALSQGLLEYDAILKYIEAYRKKNYAHWKIATEMTNQLKNDITKLDSTDDEQYASFLSAGSQLQIMIDKTNRFARTNLLLKQQLVQVNQSLVNHFITINTLETARDDLLPLINFELKQNRGLTTESQGIALSQNVIELFQALLVRNVEGAKRNIEQLQGLDISEAIYNNLNKDFDIYLQNLNNAKMLQLKIDDSDLNQIMFEHSDSEINNSDKKLNKILKPTI